MNLIEGLQNEIDRVSELIQQYRNPILKGTGEFAARLMEADIKLAKENIAGHTDVIEGLKIYNSLTEWKS